VVKHVSTGFVSITKMNSNQLGIKVQVLNANLVAMCMPYGDAYHTRSATRNAGASVQRAVVVQQAQMGSHPRPVVRNVQAVIGT
jgi:hypothetical protein